MTTSLTRIPIDVANVSALPDRPAMTAAALKAVFDKAAGDLKDYLNATTLPEIEAAIDAGGGGNGTWIFVSSAAPDESDEFSYDDIDGEARVDDLIIWDSHAYRIDTVDELGETYETHDTGGVLPMGTDGVTPDIRVSGGYIQVGYSGTYTDLIALADLKGDPGDSPSFRVDSGYFQVKIGSGSWTSLFAMADIKGDQGDSPEFKVTATHIQVKVGSGSWTNLVALADLKGADGADGNYWHASANAPVNSSFAFTDIQGTAKAGDLITHSGKIYLVTAVNSGTSTYTVSDTGDELPSGGGGSVSPYTSNPEMDGTAGPGSSANYSRGDHVHPTDTSRMAASLKGAVNGVAELDSGQKVKADQASAAITTISSNSTLALAHSGCCLMVNSSGAVNVTVPLASAVAFPVGTEIEILRWGSGTVTIKAANGVTVNGASGSSVSKAISAQFTSAVLKKLDTNVWNLQGAIE